MMHLNIDTGRLEANKYLKGSHTFGRYLNIYHMPTAIRDIYEIPYQKSQAEI